MKALVQTVILIGVCCILFAVFSFKEVVQTPYIPMMQAVRQTLCVEVKTVGELEAARSLMIASSIRGDQGKVVSLIADGVYVEPGEVLVKMDPTPFEEKKDKLIGKTNEQEMVVAALEQALKWEETQALHKNRTATYDVETARLELDKIIHGDGPLEISRLKAAMQKAFLRFEELNCYSHDLEELEAQGFLNPSEIKQAKQRLAEEWETYEIAKQQHDAYVHHVYPMQIKKAEASLKRAEIGGEEAVKSGEYTISKAKALLEQAKQVLVDLAQQLKEVDNELKATEIKAPAHGMVVHREDYRNGQKRKPRVGDVVVKNQPLLDLPDLTSMVVKTKVREIDLYKVSIGKKATIAIDAYPEMSFSGTISSIGVLALGDCLRPSDEKYFEVRISLNVCDKRLRPGMTARATIHALTVPDALTIPLHSIFEEEGQTFCYLLNEGQQYEKLSVLIGACNEQFAEVMEGLDEGSCVCLLNPYQ